MTAWFPPVMEIVIECLVIQMTEVILPPFWTLRQQLNAVVSKNNLKED